MAKLFSNGEHDRLWKDVMLNQNPSIKSNTLDIANSLNRHKIENKVELTGVVDVLMASKELVDMGWMHSDTFAQLCTDILSDVYDIKKIQELDERNWKKSSGSKEEKEK